MTDKNVSMSFLKQGWKLIMIRVRIKVE